MLSCFAEFECLNKIKTEIENKCNIQNEMNWSTDEIKQAFEETKIMHKNSREKKDWFCVIVLQELKRKVSESDLKKKEERQTDISQTESDMTLTMESNVSEVAEDFTNTITIEEQLRNLN